jgi:hypothetical protein
MKKVGFVLIAIGVALLIFILFNALQQNNQLKSPVPDDKGVKVIFITPSP